MYSSLSRHTYPHTHKKQTRETGFSGLSYRVTKVWKPVSLLSIENENYVQGFSRKMKIMCSGKNEIYVRDEIYV